MRDSNPRGYETSFAYAQLARSRSPTGLLAARRDGPHTLACGSSSQQRFAETLVDPASPATSEQSPLCDHVIFCLRHKKPPGASLPCSSSPQKVTLRLRCSLVNALTTLWLATNFFRKRARAQLFPYPASRAFAPQFSQPSQKSADAAKCLPIFTSSLFTIHSSLPGRADFWKGITKREERRGVAAALYAAIKNGGKTQARRKKSHRRSHRKPSGLLPTFCG